MPYPEHGGRFTGEPGYFKHVTGAAKGLMEKMGTSPDDYDNAVFHQPNGKIPRKGCKKCLVLTKSKLNRVLWFQD